MEIVTLLSLASIVSACLMFGFVLGAWKHFHAESFARSALLLRCAGTVALADAVANAWMLSLHFSMIKLGIAFALMACVLLCIVTARMCDRKAAADAEKEPPCA